MKGIIQCTVLLSVVFLFSTCSFKSFVKEKKSPQVYNGAYVYNAKEALLVMGRLNTGLFIIEMALQKCRSLAVKSSNGIYTVHDRKLFGQTFGAYMKEIAYIRNQCSVGRVKLLKSDDPSYKGKISIRGVDGEKNIVFILPRLNCRALGFSEWKLNKAQRYIDLSTAASSSRAIALIDRALDEIVAQRSRVLSNAERISLVTVREKAVAGHEIKGLKK